MCVEVLFIPALIGLVGRYLRRREESSMDPEVITAAVEAGVDPEDLAEEFRNVVIERVGWKLRGDEIEQLAWELVGRAINAFRATSED